MLYLPDVVKQNAIEKFINPGLEEYQQQEEIIFLDDLPNQPESKFHQNDQEYSCYPMDKTASINDKTAKFASAIEMSVESQNEVMDPEEDEAMDTIDADIEGAVNRATVMMKNADVYAENTELIQVLDRYSQEVERANELDEFERLEECIDADRIDDLVKADGAAEEQGDAGRVGTAAHEVTLHQIEA